MRVQLLNACMHVTTIFQITEYSLMDNSCMSVQKKTHLRSEKGQCTIIWMNIFPIKGISSMMRIYLLQDCVVGSEVSECVKRPIHTSGCTGPQSKLYEEIGGLEGIGEGLWESFDSLWVAVRDCTKS